MLNVESLQQSYVLCSHSFKCFMKHVIFLTLFYLLFSFLSCKKSNECVSAEITKKVINCFDTVWAVKLDKEIYAADSIPVAYQQERLKVCIVYTLYYDPHMCPCCGGTYADIISIKKLE